jgi:gliding motility-associated lipoprotein GldH
MKYLTGALFLVFIISACQPTPFYEEEISVDPLGWPYDQKKIFEVNVTDTLPLYDMHLNVIHDDTYSYQNLYLKVTTSFPHKDAKEEQLSIDLAEKNGQWIGKCSGGRCKLKVYLLEKFKFASAGKYSFAFEQYGRDPNLKGIDELSLSLFELEKK